MRILRQQSWLFVVVLGGLLGAGAAAATVVSDAKTSTAALRCAGAYGIVMGKTAGDANTAAMQGRLRLLAAIEAYEGFDGSKILTSDEAVEGELAAAADLNPVVAACDKQFGYQVAAGIKLPEPAYVVNTPEPVPPAAVQDAPVTFVNESTADSTYNYSAPVETTDDKCVALLPTLNGILYDVTEATDRYDALVDMNSMPHIIEAQQRIVARAASSGAERLQDLTSHARELGCDESVLGEWDGMVAQLRSLAGRFS